MKSLKKSVIVKPLLKHYTSTSLFEGRLMDESGSAGESESFIVGSTGDFPPEHALSAMARMMKSALIIVKIKIFLIRKPP